MNKINKNHPPSVKKVVRTSFLVDVSDIVLNLIVAISSGSVVIFSQVLQGVADFVSSGLLLVGVRRSEKHASKRYQFGYGREMFFWALLSAIFTLMVTGALSFYIGFQRFLSPDPINHIGWTFVVLTIGFITNTYAFSLSKNRLTKYAKGSLWNRFTHSGMVETKTTLVLDITGSLASVFGLFALISLLLFDNLKLDGLGAMLIGASTAILALFLIKDAKDLLVGKSASPETTQSIIDAALMIKGVEKILDIRTMYIGSAKLLVNLELHLEHGLKTRQIEEIMDSIKEQVIAKVPSVHHIQVELESPDDKDHL
jgi:cation diffusion facilitator family transporter